MAVRNSRITLFIAAVLIAVLGVSLWWMNRVLTARTPDFGGGDFEFVVEEGMTLNQVARLLEGERLIRDRASFKWAARLMQAERRIQPGIFLLPRGVSNVRIIRYLLRPGIRTKDITIPEGLTVRQIAGLISRELGLDSSEFVRLCEDPAFTAELGIPTGRLEGYLFPDTYNFYIDDDLHRVMGKMVSGFFTVFDDTLRSCLSQAGFTLHNAVTLASIIQGEVIVDEEAPLVSAVYHNRMRRGMPLAADPTIQYIIPDGPRRLLKRDLEIDSPYNTYRRRGLPPGPVNNPGKSALEAAVNPADVDYLYFVARGDGSHAFNSSYQGHLRDKQKFDKVRRKVAKKERMKDEG